MGRITAIEPQKRHPQRVNLFVDGEFRCGLYRISAAWLQIGQELTEARLTELQAADEREAAHQQALRLLERRDRTAMEISRNLQQHGFSEAVIDEELQRLAQSHLVDDARFAQNWVENRAEFRPRGRRALAQELRQHGLSSEAIAEATADLDEESLAYQAGLHYSRKLSNVLERNIFRQKLAAFLTRRGFSYDVVAPVVQRIWQEKHSEAS